MHSTKRALWAILILLPLLMGGSVSAFADDDDATDDVKARVARFSFIRGDVQVRRTGNKDWEKAAINLPVVEGDEISVGNDSRTEIQIDSTSYLRLNGRAYLKVTTLRDEGIALSIPQGTISVRLLEFDKAKSFFEIDAPMTTVAIQKSGIYRIDSGSDSDKTVRVSATEFGEARVYTDNAGFTLHNGRNARINIEGALAGEYETADAARFSDEFDTWSLDRDTVIAKRLKDAFYDKYYDRDIYGAEDLNDNGEWIHTKQYGYVWRPYATSTAPYANWSPYRYGSWRWVPPFGWTWVNDEPWGWATYHHGRWVFDNGYWVWTPYGYQHVGRSWWSPALVVFSAIRDSFCWYPLPYTYVSFNFNYYYHGHRGRHDNDGRDGRGRGNRDDRNARNNPVPSISPSPEPIRGPKRMQDMPYYNVPVGGIVTVPASEFGSGSRGYRAPSDEMAKIMLAKDPADINTIPRLPKFEDVSAKSGKEIRSEAPPVRPIESFRVGVADRKTATPVDDELRNTRILGNREPVQKAPDVETGNSDQMEKGGARMRGTGAVQRPNPVNDRPVTPTPSDEKKRDEPVSTPQSIDDAPRKAVMPRVDRKDDEPQVEQPRRSVEPRSEQPKREEPKRDEPRREEPKREEPKSEPPPQREMPRSEPPPKRDDPPPRSEPPARRDDPPARSEPPKSDPKSEPKDDQPRPEKPDVIERKKDGSS